MPGRLPLGIVLVAAGIFTGPALRAEEVDGLVSQADKLLGEQNHQGALFPLRTAYDRAPRVDILARLGLAERGLGRWVEAEVHLTQALASANHGPWVVQHRAELNRALDEVRGQLATLTVEGRPRAAAVRIDGELRGLLPLPRPLRVVAGTVRVAVTAPGYRPFHRDLTVGSGQTVPVAANLTPEGSSGPATPAIASGLALASPASPGPPADAQVSEKPRREPGLWRRLGVGLLAGGLIMGTAGGYAVLVHRPVGPRAAAVGVPAFALGAGLVTTGSLLIGLDF